MAPHRRWKVESQTARVSEGPSRAWTRSFISRAALRVKVRAAIERGSTLRSRTRCTTRVQMTRVFPEPGPAMTSSAPSGAGHGFELAVVEAVEQGGWGGAGGRRCGSRHDWRVWGARDRAGGLVGLARIRSHAHTLAGRGATCGLRDPRCCASERDPSMGNVRISRYTHDEAGLVDRYVNPKTAAWMLRHTAVTEGGTYMPDSGART